MSSTCVNYLLFSLLLETSVFLNEAKFTVLQYCLFGLHFRNSVPANVNLVCNFGSINNINVYIRYWYSFDRALLDCINVDHLVALALNLWPHMSLPVSLCFTQYLSFMHVYSHSVFCKLTKTISGLIVSCSVSIFPKFTVGTLNRLRKKYIENPL